jgi:hypothetical protein
MLFYWRVQKYRNAGICSKIINNLQAEKKDTPDIKKEKKPCLYKKKVKLWTSSGLRSMLDAYQFDSDDL